MLLDCILNMLPTCLNVTQSLSRCSLDTCQWILTSFLLLCVLCEDRDFCFVVAVFASFHKRREAAWARKQPCRRRTRTKLRRCRRRRKRRRRRRRRKNKKSRRKKSQKKAQGEGQRQSRCESRAERHSESQRFQSHSESHSESQSERHSES